MKRALIFAILLLAPAAASAHDWYPLECCSGMDCAAVEKVEILPMQSAGIMGSAGSFSTMLVTTKHGTVLVPANFPRRESKDNQMHACMRVLPGSNSMRLICLFLPPST